MDLVVKPGGVLQGEASVPGDKSISHRAVILGSISLGTSILKGFLEANDCLATLNAMKSLGVEIERITAGVLRIEGVGLRGFQAPQAPLDCGNSGTTMRLLAGLLAAMPFKSILKGDDSLQRRPMERIIKPLTQMGAKISGRLQSGHIVAPLMIQGRPLEGIHYTLPVASAQVKSCLLLAGLLAKNKTIITENKPTRDHTERLLRSFGNDLIIKASQITVLPAKALKGQEITIPGDMSSAAFFIAGASMKLGSHIFLRDVGVNERRIGLIHILKAMGAHIRISNVTEKNGEPVGDIEVKGSPLQGITVPGKWIEGAIDEFPMLFVVAACAAGKTIIHGISELRVKESDRIAVMAKGLKNLGVDVEELPDGLVIQGGAMQGGIVESQGDHRVAMAFAMGGLLAKNEIVIRDCANIATSFPTFCDVAKRLGLAVEV